MPRVNVLGRIKFEASTLNDRVDSNKPVRHANVVNSLRFPGQSNADCDAGHFQKFIRAVERTGCLFQRRDLP